MLFNLYYLYFLFFLFMGVLFYLTGLYFLYLDYVVLIDWDILSINSCSIVFTLLFDWMSLIFVGSVMLISSMVILYSSSYMSTDFNSNRFLLLVVMFVFSMCFMVLSPNLISILLGWDGLGLVSYCLVIYFQNFKSYNAGMLTVLTNRIGDVAILLGISYLFSSGSWYFMYYNYYIYDWSYLLLLFSLLASFTKSAQIPFSSWLPAAMAAPTPVSALVHSSTLVTAGVYLLIRFNYLILSFDVSFFLLLSTLTMFMSGLGANFEFDMKKIIALSTLSQLGLMMSILFMGYPIISFFHLLSHAFFKALLFLCAGLFIHCVNDTQDIRYMGGLMTFIPYTGACFGVANFSLCGLPFLSGFYSKDLILEIMNMNYFNLFIYMLFYVSVGLTAFYSLRLVYYCLFGCFNLLSYNCYFEDKNMMFSMIFLIFMGIMKGSILCWLFFPYPDLIVLSYELKFLAIIFIIMGFYFGYEFSIFGYTTSYFGSFFYDFLGTMWFMPNFSTLIPQYFGFNVSLNYLEFVDYGWGEYMISRISSLFLVFMSIFNTYLQYNNLKIYFLIFFSFSFILIFI
uniref:NADH-ubiquinone oxidoreductase chain 5 n=1 Tax=Meschia woodwardi TaxID=2813447 RepID=A0A8T9ZWM4_9HEMI|nr:NADH dehydrogenase subunit 5 [Meschia woodwardi]